MEVNLLSEADYLALLTREIEQLMDRHVEQTGSIPRKLLMPKSKYVVLEDYCLSREQEIYFALLLQSSQATGAQLQQVRAKIEIARTRMRQLSNDGVRLFSCKYGQIPIVVQRDVTRVEIH